ncbi:MAG: DUF1631 family protein [Pseudomonadales bacterium]
MSFDLPLEEALAKGQFSTAEVSEGNERTRATLLARLVGLQNVDLPPDESLEQAIQRPGAMQLSQQEANLLYFCDQVFEQGQSQTDLEPELLNAFLALRPLVASVLLREPQVLRDLQHPLFHLLDQLWDAGRYWSPELGKPGEKYRQRLDEMLQRVRTADPTTALFQTWLEELDAQLAKDFQRANTLVERIRQTAQGALAGEAADRIVRRQISALLERAPMPDVVEELLKGPLLNSMKMVYLSKGHNSDEWKQVVRVSEMLIDSMLGAEDDAGMQQVYQTIPKVIPLLAKNLVSVTDAAEMESWVTRVEKLHMQILLGGKVEVRPAHPLSGLSDENGVAANISSALLDQVRQIPEGQWLVYQRDGREKLHCRLIMKSDDGGQLLFANVLGAKCLEKTLEEFAYLLTARHILLLDNDNNFSQVFRDTVANFLQLYQRQSLMKAEIADRQRAELERRRLAQEKAKREAERIAQEKLEAQARAEEAARKQAEEQARLAEIAAQKAAEEARKKAEEAQRAAEEAAQHQKALAAKEAAEAAKRQREVEEAERERLLQAEKQARIDEWEAVQNSVRTLGIGAWVDIEINGERQRCKLAAVMNATDKLIFVGRDGKKLAEPRRDELIKMLLDNKARIVQQGDQFENSLAKVIQTLRKE